VIIGRGFTYNWRDLVAEEASISIEAGSEERRCLSIVIPAYNESRRILPTLGRLYDYLSNQPYGWEIIVVSNGCTDNTEAVVQQAAGDIPNLRLISVAERGKGIASRTGALAAIGDVVFLCDADLSMPPENLAAFIDMMRSADVIAGSREGPGAKRFDEPWHRHFMGRVFNFLVQLLAVRGINDTQCGFKAFSRQAADHLFRQQTLKGFAFDVELLYLARRAGYTVRELPIDWYFDPDTRVRPGVDTLNMLGELVMIRLRSARGLYSRPIGSRSVTGEDVVG
jgi:dolichyl-phosphate beta-glucosyltransferase